MQIDSLEINHYLLFDTLHAIWKQKGVLRGKINKTYVKVPDVWDFFSFLKQNLGKVKDFQVWDV